MNSLFQFIKNIFTVLIVMVILLPNTPTAKPINTKNTIKFISQKSYDTLIVDLHYLNIKIYNEGD